MTPATRRPAGAGLLLSLADRLVRLALRAYPASYRARFGRDLAELFRDAAGEELARGGRPGLAGLTGRTLADILRDAAAESRRARIRARAYAPRARRWSPDMLLQDLRYAFRGVRREPRFALLVVLTLAVGIGANTAMFSIVNGVLLSPLPFPQPDRLVRLYGSFSQDATTSISPPDFLDYRARNDVFESMAARRTSSIATLSGDGDAEQVRSGTVTANYFATLGVAPALGRGFRPEEENGGPHDVVVLSYGLWQRRYGGDPDILGRTIAVNGRAHEVIGVMPRGFDMPHGAQLWVPIAFGTPGASVRRFHQLRGVARLKDGVSIDAAQADLDVIARDLERMYPENATWKLNVVPLHEDVVGNVRPALVMLSAAVALVLLIACGNVTSLMLARATVRQNEIAIRSALGASRGSLARELLTESAVYALSGGAVGLMLARLALDAVRAAATLPRLDAVRMDGTVLLFTLGAALLTGLLSGLGPALTRRPSVLGNTASGTRTSEARAGRRAREGLVMAQVAVSLVLLVAAGLLIQSLWRLQQVDLGFEPAGVLTARVPLSRATYETAADVDALFDRLLDETRALAGVERAGLLDIAPLSGTNYSLVYLENRPPVDEADKIYAEVRTAAGDAFEALRIPIAEGRALTDDDRPGTVNAVVVNRKLAAALTPGESPLGRRIVLDLGKPYVAEIVGVSGDVREWGPDAPAPPIMYVSNHQETRWGMAVVARTSLPPASLAAPLRAIVRKLDPAVPLANVTTLEDQIDQVSARPRFRAVLLGAFAATAFLMALLGLYGTLSYSVSRRTRELGVRLALGARPAEVRGLVVRQGLVLVAIGLTGGLAGAVAAGRLIEGLLFEVTPTEPAVYAIVTAGLLVAGLAACLVPARRASRVDPAVTLRME